MKTSIKLLSLLITVMLLFCSCKSSEENISTTSTTVAQTSAVSTAEASNTSTKTSTDAVREVKYNLFNEVPEFDNLPYVAINNNVPDFADSELKTVSYEKYGSLDSLGRCTVCIACIGEDIMPTEKRGAIGEVKPTGWHSDKYDNVDGRYLYNRCHLIGYQLTAENANERNLITGTRYLNVQGMLPFEDMVDDYIEETGNHVLYEVTPQFKGNELVARGVHMQAKSVEDSGKGISFNVYCYNAQPGIEINYATGDSKAVKEKDNFNDGSTKQTYIINTSSKKFHHPDCEAVDKMSPKNKKKYKGTRESLIKNGYDPCGICNP